MKWVYEQINVVHEPFINKCKQQTALVLCMLGLAVESGRFRWASSPSLQVERSAAPQGPAAAGGGGPTSATTTSTSAQLSRLHESTELLAEQERAIAALMERLRHSRHQEAHYRDRVARSAGWGRTGVGQGSDRALDRGRTGRQTGVGAPDRGRTGHQTGV